MLSNANQQHPNWANAQRDRHIVLRPACTGAMLPLLYCIVLYWGLPVQGRCCLCCIVLYWGLPVQRRCCLCCIVLYWGLPVQGRCCLCYIVLYCIVLRPACTRAILPLLCRVSVLNQMWRNIVSLKYMSLCSLYLRLVWFLEFLACYVDFLLL
jgi:hypothetical protein